MKRYIKNAGLLFLFVIFLSGSTFGDIVNGDFNEGLNDWTADQNMGEDLTGGYVFSENGQAVLQTAGFSNGIYMVSLWQSFEIPDGATTLSFDFLFDYKTSEDDFVLDLDGDGDVDEDDLSDQNGDGVLDGEDVNTFPDWFQVSYLDDDASSSYDRFFIGVDTAGFYDDTFVDLPTGTINNLEDNWYRYTTTINDLAGSTGTLYFDLNDQNDGWYSRARVDNVVISTSAAPVPEPATMLLLASGLAGLAGFRKKFIKK
ncbi:MAG: PEP-CTERM sorting domain-containing protein [Deltaproteobacteria bacterium]|nr:PEP-CTERM sorting domain-containing protein [Deltaproteobacteria bacterium]